MAAVFDASSRRVLKRKHWPRAAGSIRPRRDSRMRRLAGEPRCARRRARRSQSAQAPARSRAPITPHVASRRANLHRNNRRPGVGMGNIKQRRRAGARPSVAELTHNHVMPSPGARIFSGIDEPTDATITSCSGITHQTYWQPILVAACMHIIKLRFPATTSCPHRNALLNGNRNNSSRKISHTRFPLLCHQQPYP